MVAALEAGVVRPAILFHGEFASGDLRLWSGLGEIEVFQQWVPATAVRNRVTWSEDPTNVAWNKQAVSVTPAGVVRGFPLFRVETTALPSLNRVGRIQQGHVLQPGVYTWQAVQTANNLGFINMFVTPIAPATVGGLAGSRDVVFNTVTRQFTVTTLGAGGAVQALDLGGGLWWIAITFQVTAAGTVFLQRGVELLATNPDSIGRHFFASRTQLEAGAVATEYQRVDAAGQAFDAVGDVFTGAGSLLALSEIEDGVDLMAAGASVTLSGIPLALVQTCIADVRQGMPGRIYLALLDEFGRVIDNTPALLFEGRVDVPEIHDDADTCVITLTYESRLIDLNRSRLFRYTDEDQKAVFPGDRAFEFVTAIQDVEITWGR